MIELLNEDCMTYMATLPDKYFDLACVDPPYGIDVNHNIGRRKGGLKSAHKEVRWDSEPPKKEYFLELERVSKNQIIWGANHFMDLIGKRSSCWLVWDKLFSEDVSFASCELAYTSFNSVVKRFKLSSVRTEMNIHPTQKPVKLYEWLLHNYAKPGQRILDTHLGSGSSAIAAHYFGCDFIGTELDKDYYDAAVNRFNLATAQQTIFDLEFKK